MSSRAYVVLSFAVALLVAGVLAQYASGHPDGLMYVAESHGLLPSSSGGSIVSSSPLAGYSIHGFEGSGVARAAAGVAGCLVTFAAVNLVTRRRA